MSKIKLIAQHEYLTRIKNKSFITMTLLGPFILALLMVVPIGLSIDKYEDSAKVLVIDPIQILNNKMPRSDLAKFSFKAYDIEEAKQIYREQDYDYVLYISQSALNNPRGFSIISHKAPSRKLIQFIERKLDKNMTVIKLKAEGVDKKTARKAYTRVRLNYLELGDSNTPSAEVQSAIGIFGGVLIYFFIFLYGTMIMKSVMTEKQNRIIEIIASSAKPFQIMMGKIIGTLLAGLTQLLAWIVLSTAVTSFVNLLFIQPKTQGINSLKALGGENPLSILADLQIFNFPMLISAFIVFFVLGYLLYGSLFASIGAAVSQDSETQQFVFPLTVPLLLSFIILPELVDGANSSLTTFLSYFPFTSPVIMLVRIITGVALWEVLLSIGILIITVLVFVKIAGKIYKTGILMHGQPVNYRTIKKWIFTK